MAEIITYETIRAAHRAEKEDKLQKLPAGFFSAVRQWIEHKSGRRDTQSMLEVESAKKILEELVNRREKKIVLAALHTVRGNLPPDGLTLEEQKFFDSMILNLKNFKDDVQQQMWSYDKFVEEKISEARKLVEDLPRREEEKVKSVPQIMEKENGLNENISATHNREISEIASEKLDAQPPAAPEIPKEIPRPELRKIKLLMDLPQFVGADLNYYGPFAIGQTTEVPPEVAGLLSMRGAAEVVA